jgi:pilus assembly protein CpaD
MSGQAAMESHRMTIDPLRLGRDRRGPRRADRRLAAAAALVLLLAGCSTSKHQDVVGSIPDDYRVNHPITIDEQLATMDVPVGLDTARLSAPVKGNIAGFAQRFNASGSGLMAIVVPDGSPNEAAATGISHRIYDVLVGAGVRPGSIDFRAYPAGPSETNAPVRLAFNKITARVEGCGAWPDRLENDVKNRNYENFGCSTQANLAAMVDNPLDLLYPRALAPADAARRSAVLDNYRKGDIYSAKQRLERGEISEVGN